MILTILYFYKPHYAFLGAGWPPGPDATEDERRRWREDEEKKKKKKVKSLLLLFDFMTRDDEL